MAAESQPDPSRDIISVPATPSPQSRKAEESIRSPSHQANALHSSTTPPPSSQIPSDSTISDDRAVRLPSTPTTSRKNASKDLPTVDHIERAGTEELRHLVKGLVNDLTDARISVANSRLQHHLLLLETSQAAERAEVENQLSRTQVDFLRVKQTKPDYRGGVAVSGAVQSPANSSHLLVQTVRDLESHCDTLEEICETLKQEKELLAERIQSLSEHNSLLVNRIRENREHFTRIRERSPIFVPPREAYTTPRRRGYSRYQDDTPFAALIAADQILSQETASVPSTPTKSHTARFKYGHSRGAHSLSSITTPQTKDRPSTSDGFLGSQLLLSAPGSQLVNESAERERRDRDSTISISDNDNVADQEEFTQSQASSLAADMLRKNPSAFESHRQSQEAEKSSNLLQSKILGSIKKSGHETSAKLKRQYAFHETPPKNKKIRSDEKIGLGIGA